MFDKLDTSEVRDQLKLKKNPVLNSTIENENDLNIDLINRYSSFMKLIRIIIYCPRFQENFKLKSRIKKM